MLTACLEGRAVLNVLPLIEWAATNDRSFARKAVNLALRNLGKRNGALNAAALACSREILASATTRAGGPCRGDASARSARWSAMDAIRELGADKVSARLHGRDST